jgi:UPF0755 protein
MQKETIVRTLKFFFGFGLFAATALIVVMAGGFWWAAQEFKNPGPLSETKIIEIKRGSGLDEIAWTLRNENAVENPYIFILGARVLNVQSALKAGEYELAPAISPREILEKMKNGDVYVRRFTIAEGRTSFEVVQILNSINALSGEIKNIPAEGSLFPTTYDYKENEDRNAVIARMQSAMIETLDKLWETRAHDLPFTTKAEALILASIVEKETGVPSERKTIAGVFINRLKTGMPLQTDPTVIYAINKGANKNDGLGPLGRRLLSKDLEVDSPYNTYKNAGLPPGPIANPGRDSIAAVLNPEKNEYFYFVADGTGGHVFAKTLAEHNANVAKWREIRKERGL